MDLGQIGYLPCGSDLDDIAQSDSEILPHCFVHSDLSFFQFIINQRNHKGFFSLFALDEDGVTFEDFEFGHFRLR